MQPNQCRGNLIAGRCGALAVLMASSFSCAVAQQKMTCERGPKDWPVHHTGAIVDDASGCCADLTALVKRSEIIVRGRVTDSNGRLSRDEREVWTDYTISVQEIYKQGGRSNFARGANIQATNRGGHMLVDGHPVEYDVGPSPISQGIPEIFFMSTCNAPDCSTVYGAPDGSTAHVTRYWFAAGSLAAISLENGQVSCSARPHQVWKPYCGMTADTFISAVKEKVALLTPEGDQVSFLGAGAQQTMPPTLRERAAKEGRVRAGAIVDYVGGCCVDLADLVKRSEIIVLGEVADSKGKLSHDETEVWTDYTISIQEIYKQGVKSSFAPGARIQATRRGGHMLIDSHPVEYNVGTSPIPQGIPEIFFIATCSGPECSGAYSFFPGLEAVCLDNGQVSCSARPSRVWKPYCGVNASSFISTLKQVVMSLGDVAPK